MSWKDNEYSPLYRPGQAFREETSDRLTQIAMGFTAIGALGMLLTITSNGFAGALGSAFFLLGAIVGGGTYLLILVRGHYRRRAGARHRDPDPRVND